MVSDYAQMTISALPILAARPIVAVVAPVTTFAVAPPLLFYFGGDLLLPR